MRGNVIISLENGFKNSGNHKVIWDGKNYNGESVASGMYIYTISENSIERATKKMLLLH